MSDPSIVYSKDWIPFSNVENGTAYDFATLSVDGATTLVVPDTAIIQQSNQDGQVKLFMEKQQSFFGHPSKLISIQNERKGMGCALKSDNNTLIIATHGEWTTIEGGGKMKLVLLVPEGIKVEKRASLAGQNTSCWDLMKGSLVDGWKLIPDEPDALHTAKFFIPP